MRDAAAPSPGGGEVRWATTAWLESELGGDVVVLDTQPDVHDYLEMHIPGAVWMDDASMRAHVGGSPHAFAPPAAAGAVLRAAGVRSDSPVAVYTGTGLRTASGDGLDAFVLAYALARFGCRQVRVLDGGMDKWTAEARPMTKDVPRPRPSGFRPRVRRDLLADRARVQRLRDRPGVVLLDTRAAASYEGQTYLPRPGHIEGAVSLPWTDLVDPQNKALLRPRDELEARFGAAGVGPKSDVIVSCGTARTASCAFTVLRWHLGHARTRLYEGSVTEWAADPDLPMVEGPSPR
jgi:thiosulfate/3-mercaptopyruvate sulfurtransferase